MQTSIRKRRRLTTALIAVALMALFAITVLGTSRFSDGLTSGEITEPWVDQQLVAWQPTHFTPMSFAAMIVPASYGQVDYSYNTPQVLAGYLNLMESSGAAYIRIDVGYDAWLNGNTAVQDKLKSLVSQMRSDGKGFILADASAEKYRGLGNRLPWSQFKAAWVQRVETLASTFHPDYYVVVKEPGWYVPMISDVTTNPLVRDPSQWLGLTQNLTSAVLSVSPNTKVGVAIAADSLNQNPALYVPYLNGLSNTNGLSFMGFDIYTTTGFDVTHSYLATHGSGGLAVWMAESWSESSGKVVFDPSRITLDKKWIKAAYYFGEREGVTMMVPFFTNTFAAYNLTATSPADPAQIIGLQQQRTPVFYMYKNITAGLENVPRGTTTTSIVSGGTTRSDRSTTTASTSLNPTTTEGGHGNPFSPVETVAVVAVIAVVALLLTAAAVRKRR